MKKISYFLMSLMFVFAMAACNPTVNEAEVVEEEQVEMVEEIIADTLTVEVIEE